MPSNDTAALVVALSAQLTRFEKDLQGAVAIADKKTKEIETRFGAMNTAVQGKLSQLGASASANLGFAGTLLNTLGPAGIAAAVGIGATVGGMLALANATAEFATRSKALKEGSETVGLTITQFKLLGQAGKTVGLDFDETTAFFTKFIANMEALRDGGGPLFDALLKIDVGLLRQLSVTKDSAVAIDLLVAAYKRLNDQTQRLDLARAAGGRAGLTGGRLLESLGSQGGIAGLQARSPAIDEEQIKRAAQLKVEIEAIAKKAANIWGSMFSDEILGYEKREAEILLQIAQYIERIKTGREAIALTYSDQNQRLFNARFAPATESPLRERGISFSDRFAPATESPLRDFKRPSGGSGSNAAELAILQKHVSLLGEAATEGEKWRLKQLELAAATDKDKTVTDVAQRALDAYRITMIASALAARERLGVATQDQIVEAKLLQLNQDRVRFGLSDNEVQRARVVILREAKDAADALTVRQSYLPGLKQFELDAANARKTLDTFAVGSLNNLENALVDVVSGTKTAAEAFRAMANAIIADLARIAIRQAITGPLASALGSLLTPAGGDIYAGIAPPTNAGIGHAATGVDNWRGGLIEVGERGPELLNLPRGSQIIPNDISRNLGSGGGDINVHLSFDLTGANGDETIKRMVGAAAQKTFAAAVSASNAAMPGRQQQYRLLGT